MGAAGAAATTRAGHHCHRILAREAHVRYPRAAVLTAAVLTATTLWPVTSTAAESSPKWDVMPEVPTASGGGLRDVAALASDNAWVVGSAYTAHWNGVTWTPLPLPPPTKPSGVYDLSAVDAVGSAAWAVGGERSLSTGGTTTTAVILGYNGRGWVRAPIPASGGNAMLNDVDMLGPDGGWAVGSTMDNGGPARVLVLRARSGLWAEVTVPAVGGASPELSSVYARSDTDAWAVGSYLRADGRRASLVLHWNGAAWKQVAVPVNDPLADETLASVAALSATDVWAVGRTCSEGGLMGCRPLVLRLLGETWQVIPPADAGTEFVEVMPFSATDVWVLGYAVAADGAEHDHAQHWDGAGFTVDTSTPAPGPADPDPQGEAASAIEAATTAADASGMWAVGWATEGSTNVSHAIRRGALGN